MYQTYVRSWGYFILATLIAFGVLTVLNEDVIMHGAQITVEHVMVALIMLVTLVVGHNTTPLWKEGRYGWALLCAFVFCSGLIIEVTSSAGRLMKVAMTQEVAINRNADAFEDAKAQLKKARENHATLNDRFAKECADGLGPRCQGMEKALLDRRAQMILAQERLDKVPVVPPANIEVKYLAGVIAFWSDKPEHMWEKGLSLIYPLFRSGALGIASLVCFALSLGHRMVPIPLTAIDVEVDEPQKLLTGPASPAMMVLQAANRALTNRELAEKMHVSEGYSSKLVKSLVEQDLVEKEAIGREVYIRLKA